MQDLTPAFFQDCYRVLENRELSPLNYQLVLDAPHLANHALPGHFVQIETKGFLLKRPMSIGDVRGNEVTILYKVVGVGTQAMAKLTRGDKVDVIGPLGKPFEETSSVSRRIFVAGGVGVPPLYFLAKAQKGGPSDTVLVGARSKHDLLYVSEFKKLGLEVVTATEDGSAGHKGFVTGPFEKLLDGLQDKKNSVVYTCGPNPMMQAVAEISAKAGVRCVASLEQVMACGIGVCMGCIVKVKDGSDFTYQRVCWEGPVFDTESILW